MPVLSPSLCPLLTKEAIHELEEAAGIRTVFDFVTGESADIANKISLLSLQDVLSIRRSLLSIYSSFPVTAANLWEQMKTSSAFLSTGIPSIDSLLGGGVFTGELTEISGQSSVGKTQLCLNASAHTIVHTMSTAVYIDTNGSFSSLRLKQFIPTEEYQQDGDILKKLVVFQVSNLFELLQLIQDLKESIRKQASEFYSQLHLIVIDSLVSLLIPLMGNQLLPHLVQLIRDLQGLAHSQSIAILYTSSNDLFSFYGHNSAKPLLLKALSSAPHVKLSLSTIGDKKIAVLEKSQRLRSGSTVNLT
ncbi:PREDICTED: DNA repair protein RAD51 homolog 4-like [Amphimedon queenslandica]|uniref:RecA family profile 1 domain-containing protein n=1 Tax=Amphimedon queenslandica TaxID=400682 RepID=A0A1X7ULY8_AMPQE|nr:PREDICTED: DNA repair protein RAD51 homolog 4-like [Amphimedon queenslandica]|eukprot:XP_019853411.1 PREDICTED: DNA repair protein RAD51 homolog 4-like [Amphimedon queenslandica]